MKMLKGSLLSRVGFTLLEVLLSVMILSLVMTMLGRYFYAEKKAFAELRKKHLDETPVQDFFALFRKDLLGAVVWQEQGLTFKDGRITFHIASEEGMGRISRVDYVLKEEYAGDQKCYSLHRKEFAFPYVQEDEDREALNPVSDIICLKAVRRFDVFFSGVYSLVDENNDQKPLLFEFSEWEFKSMPVSVRVLITESSGRQAEWNSWFPEYAGKDLEEIPPLVLKDEQKELLLKQIAEKKKSQKSDKRDL